MKKLRLVLLLVFVLATQMFPQEKLLTTEDVTLNARQKFSTENLKHLSWLPNKETFAWVTRSGENSWLVTSSVQNSEIDTLLKLSELNSYLEKAGTKSLKSFPDITWTAPDEFYFWSDQKYFLFNDKTKLLSLTCSLSNDAENIEVSPNNKFAAYTKRNNLFVQLDGKNEIQISSDRDTNIVNGQAVHRNEFGINKGIFWSPKNNYIAYYRMDQTMVTDYPLVDISYTPARLKNIKYPMAGQTSHHVTIGIYNIKTGQTTWLKTGEPLDHYLTSLIWSPDEKYFYVAHLNRDQNHLELKKYDIVTGEPVKTLFEEKSDKYVEPLNPLIFLPNSNDKFLWFSQRDGYNHLYLYNNDGQLLKQVTSGKWVILDFEGFDKNGKNIFIASTKESPLDRDYYRVNIENGKMERLTSEPGSHKVLASSNSEYFIDSYNNVSTPHVINLLDKKGKLVRHLLTAVNSLKDYKLGKTKIFTIKNDEGIDLYCRMITPADFDSTKKYPVIVYVYGGPHDQEVRNIFGSNKYYLWFYMMAQKGFILFTLDNRGSANRGLEFEQATFRHLGTIEVKDQMTGVNYLKLLPYVNPNRFGVFGWSFGGFMTTSLMLRTNGAFKVGVGGGAVIDWKYYEVMYTERYMDTPQTNPEGYKEASLLNYVDNLKGKLLLVHGTSDPTVVWQNTLSFAKKCADLNKPLDYFPYVGHQHGVFGIDALHLYNKITNYFLDNL